MHRTKSFYAVCVASGLLWGLFVTFGLLEPQQREYFGWGLFFAPAIGVFAGQLSARFRSAGLALMALVAIGSLYATAVLFGFSAGLINAIIRQNEPGPLQAALSMVWGLTFFGYVFWLLPIAYLNHRFVARFVGPGEPSILRLGLR
jgi:hypothetical protein